MPSTGAGRRGQALGGGRWGLWSSLRAGAFLAPPAFPRKPGALAHTIPSFHSLGISPLQHSQTVLEAATKGSIMSGKWMVCRQFQLKEKDEWKHFPQTMRGLVAQEASQSISICGGQWQCVAERRRTWPCRWPLSVTGRVGFCYTDVKRKRGTEEMKSDARWCQSGWWHPLIPVKRAGWEGLPLPDEPALTVWSAPG